MPSPSFNFVNSRGKKRGVVGGGREVNRVKVKRIGCARLRIREEGPRGRRFVGEVTGKADPKLTVLRSTSPTVLKLLPNRYLEIQKKTLRLRG